MGMLVTWFIPDVVSLVFPSYSLHVPVTTSSAAKTGAIGPDAASVDIIPVSPWMRLISELQTESHH